MAENASVSRQTIANRANALKSCGPKTEEGKLRSSRNAVKHGIGFFTGPVSENQETEEFALFQAALREQLEPRNPVQEILVERIVSCSWRLRRVLKIETQMFVSNLGASGGRDLATGFLRNAREQSFVTLTRYESYIERSLYRALQSLSSLQNTEADKAIQAAIERHSQ